MGSFITLFLRSASVSSVCFSSSLFLVVQMNEISYHSSIPLIMRSLLLQLLFFPLCVFSFYSSRGQEYNQITSIIVDFSHLSHPVNPVQLPFRDIRIVDARFDTAKLGVVRFRDIFYKIVLDENRYAPLEDFLTRHFADPSDTSGKSLVLVLRSFWLRDRMAAEKYPKKESALSETVVRLDAFSLKDNHYQALVRIDTVFEENSALWEIKGKMVITPFEYLFKQLDAFGLTGLMDQRRKIPASELWGYYKKLFSKPRIQADTMAPGLYLNFSDFLHKKLTPYQFHLNKGATSEFFIIPEKGEAKLPADFWGCCDGEHHYIQYGGKLFQLYRDGYTYSFWGFTRLKRTVDDPHSEWPSMLIPGRLLLLEPTVHFTPVPRLMQVDMETGKTY